MADPFEDLLEEYTPDIREISKLLRSMIQEAAPGAEEVFNPDQKHLTYTTSAASSDKNFLLAPKKTFVFLVFNGFKELADSEGILGSAGKQVRFMTIKTVEEANRPALRQLISAAWADTISTAA